ncbi:MULTISPECIES: FIST signal transduction protein [Nitrincola]|uniref:Histidine kinase n=1 Tax=Nitrincola nitratireducens TaxID=1229521 RepID=W9V0A6_9GAMM|nr:MULTISPECIES: FIST C-terminal domain-containing protein [Nitrincola]EXJ12779.1 hypothetical protein D791_00120 [Nitrincola nitratireducens]
MKSYFQPSADVNQLKDTIDGLLIEDPSLRSFMLLGCDANAWNIDDVNSILKSSSVPVFGGVFPQIIYKQSNYETGFILVGFHDVPDWQVIEGLSQPESDDISLQVENVSVEWETLSGDVTLFLVVDGLAKSIAKLIESLFFNFGLEHNFIGGGAGSLSFEQKPCVITPEGIKKDCALIVRLKALSGLGVSHGWQPISEPMKVTHSEQNRVISLDWKPAFDEYRKIVEAHSGSAFNDQNFFDIAKSYPFGISKLDAEMVVRDPLMLNDAQDIVCVGDVPQDAFVKVLTGTKESLISAAREASNKAKISYDRVSEKPPALTLFIDCISRVLFLEKSIEDELNVISSEGAVVGALTLGEIANTGQDYLEFYNKTAVVCLMSENSDVGK